jgi:hypothetical protein
MVRRRGLEGSVVSKEIDELRRLAGEERRRAWAHTKLIPGRIGDTAGAFAKKHPLLAMGGAAALTMNLLSRRRRRNGVDGKTQSWQLALAAMAAQVLPDILHVVGLTVPRKSEPEEEECAGEEELDAEVPNDGAEATRRGGGSRVRWASANLF